MQLNVDSSLQRICRDILSKFLSDTDWAAIESDDMFEEGPFVGGYDATENAFTFSYYDSHGNEYWFQLTMEEVGQIGRDEVHHILARPADK